MHLHVPAGDADFGDDEAEQVLFLVEVEGVDDGQDACGEVTDALAELVAAGEFVALGGERLAALLQVAAAVGGVGGAALHLGWLKQAGLVEVDEPAPLAVEGGAVRCGTEE